MENIQSNASCPRLDGLLEPKLFKALSDRNRISLLVGLTQCGTPCSVSQIAECCPVDFSVVSRHLAILRDAGILEARKQGKEVYYSVRFSSLVGTLRTIADAIEACCSPGDSHSKEISHE